MSKIITIWVVCLFISFGWAVSLDSRADNIADKPVDCSIPMMDPYRYYKECIWDGKQGEKDE